MNQSGCSSLAEEECGDGKVIKLEPHIKDRGTRIITEDGDKSPQQYLDDQRMAEATQDANEVRSTYLDETNRDKKQRRHQQRIFGRSERPPIFDRKVSYDQSSYVRHLNEEDIVIEKVEQIMRKNQDDCLPSIKETIAGKVRNYLKIKDDSTIPRGVKTEITECILLGFTVQPYTPLELANDLDAWVEEVDPKLSKEFKFADNIRTFTEKVRAIHRAKNENTRWMANYFNIYTNGERKPLSKTKAHFHPSLMQIAAQNPDVIRRGWFVRLQDGDTPYTERDLKHDLPKIDEQMIGFTKISHSHHKHEDDVDGETGLTLELRTRRHQNQSHRFARVKEAKNMWATILDLKKWEILLIVMIINECIINTTEGWLKLIVKFMTDNKNPKQNVKVLNTEINTTRRNKLENEELAISKLVYTGSSKNSKIPVYGLYPDAARILLEDLLIMSDPKKKDQGWILLKRYCEKDNCIDRVVYPEKYKEKVTSEEIIESAEVVDSPDAQTQSSAFDITGGEEISTELQSLLADLIRDTPNEVIGALVKKNANRIANILGRLKLEINMKISF